MILHSEISDTDLKLKLKNKEILYGGNISAKIYGTLSCASGKRLDRENRVFFTSEENAKQTNYRPCGHCMRKEYKKWKNKSI
ncbi:MAG TPA: Ada metal-binding domain-containing protein [Edaphocola sp.]|nr:Ada metal-binding domain-containing protein [Edaphocola sp.]